MVTVLAVADGASEPLRPAAQTSLERAATPAVDRLLHSGVLQRAATVADGLLPGTEVGLPALLGVVPAAQPGRGLIDAVAAACPPALGQGVWRLDLVPAATPTAAALARLQEAVAILGARVVHLRGHRCLLFGPAAWGDAPAGPHQTTASLDDMAAGPFAEIVRAARAALGIDAWPWGSLRSDWPDLPRQLGRRIAVVAGGGAPLGIARLLGCEAVQADPAAAVATVAAADDSDVVIIHDASPDDAAHSGDTQGKVAALERFDADVVGPVAQVLRRRGGRMIVAADHGCDPATRRHDGAPVPLVLWTANSPDGGHRPRWTERDAQHLGAVQASTFLRESLALAGV